MLTAMSYLIEILVGLSDIGLTYTNLVVTALIFSEVLIAGCGKFLVCSLTYPLNGL